MTQPKIRVLVVEDSTTVRKRLIDVLGADPALTVVGEAGDGKRAIELCAELRPDVITLDMMLPVMSGLAATEYIMAHFPTPILVVSASMNRGEVYRTFESLAAGAVDVLDKPTGDEVADEWERKLVATVKLVSRIKVITHLRARLTPNAARQPDRESAVAEGHACRLVAIGASTGGPGALVEVLRTLPVRPAVPVLMVLHIDEPFAAAFGDWLDGQITRSVAYGVDGEPVGAIGGRVVMAPPGKHMVIEGGRVRLSAAPERHSCRPSIDVLFESIARDQGAGSIGCLLTGMGRDGAAGLLEMRQRGAITIAQDEQSSVVYGMPREAALLGAAERILPLAEIGPTIRRLVERAGSTR